MQSCHTRLGIKMNPLVFAISILALKASSVGGERFSPSSIFDAARAHVSKPNLFRRFAPFFYLSQPTYIKDEGSDRIRNLPGVGTPSSDIYSGYITVDNEAGRTLFYAFVESSNSPSQDPLVLWLNGGPGCSSLAGGFLSELGPYYPTTGGQRLQENQHAWTKAANVIFLESPAFVGWSYSNTTEDRTVGDGRTARDTLIFLLKFLDKYPQFKGRPFFASGESYGGHYVPNLALAITKHNDDVHNADKINLQGFLIGNAWTDPRVDNEGAVDFWFSHAIISADTQNAFKDACNFSHIGPLLTSDSPKPVDPQRCREILESSAQDFLGINIYDVYADICVPRAASQVEHMAHMASAHPVFLGADLQAAANRLRQAQGKASCGGRGNTLPGKEVVPYDPCVDNEVETYFNRPDVQEAMHANVSGILPGPWTGCSRFVNYSQRDLFSSMLPVYQELLTKELRILIFSGDVDGIVPVTGSRRWIQQLGLNIEKPWRSWHSATGQVGGRVVEHNSKFTFATVRNAGHMVPYTQAERSFHLFQSYIKNEPL